MNDREPFDGHDPHLSERMERAVGGLIAPDVVARAMARGRRQRTHRRFAYAAGGTAAATALVLTVPTFATDWPGQQQGPSGPTVAADPADTSPTTAAPGSGGTENDLCGASAPGWWSKSRAQIKAELSALLPEGIRIGETTTDVAGTWGGTLITGDDVDSLSLTLLPPSGVLGPRRTLEEVMRLGPCGGGSNEPAQAVKPCDEITGPEHVACEEIRAENGNIVGVVTEQTQLAVVNGGEQPTDRTYFLAALAGPEGGHVELIVGEGAPTDRPNTVHDPADLPALTMNQVHDIVSNPVWTS